MPDSFGRVESHCFWLANARLTGNPPKASPRNFLKKSPPNARTNRRCITCLVTSVKNRRNTTKPPPTISTPVKSLIPITSTPGRGFRASAGTSSCPASRQRDEILFNILRLDPLQRHGNPQFGQASDLVGLWNTVAAAAGRRPPKTLPLLFHPHGSRRPRWKIKRKLPPTASRRWPMATAGIQIRKV